MNRFFLMLKHRLRDHRDTVRVVPDDMAARLERQVALSAQQWAELGELERFALCKLARPGHDHHNLEAAFAELLPPSAPRDGSPGHQPAT